MPDALQHAHIGCGGPPTVRQEGGRHRAPRGHLSADEARAEVRRQAAQAPHAHAGGDVAEHLEGGDGHREKAVAFHGVAVAGALERGGELVQGFACVAQELECHGCDCPKFAPVAGQAGQG